MTRATLEAREEVQRVTRALRGLGGPWRNLALVATPAQIACDGRRIAGRYTLTVADSAGRARTARRGLPGGISRVDVHATDPARKATPARVCVRKSYDIPLCGAAAGGRGRAVHCRALHQRRFPGPRQLPRHWQCGLDGHGGGGLGWIGPALTGGCRTRCPLLTLLRDRRV